VPYIIKKWRLILKKLLILLILIITFNYIFADLISSEEILEDEDADNITTEIHSNRPVFMQGLYITAYKTVAKDFDIFLVNAKNAGINTIVFDVKEMSGEVYFDISTENSTIYKEPLFDIDNVVNQIRNHEFYTVARVVQFYNKKVATDHPELRIKNKNGGYWSEKENEYRWLDQSHPSVQSDLLKIIEAVAKSTVDEIQLDYIRFPLEGKYRQASYYYQKEDDEKFKQDENYQKRNNVDVIFEYLSKVRQICDLYDKKLTIDVFGSVAWDRYASGIMDLGQDIAVLSPLVDSIQPMLYSSHFGNDFSPEFPNFKNRPYNLIKEGIELSINKISENCNIIPYIQAFNWGIKDYTKEYMFDQINASLFSGAGGYILWNASGNYANAINWVKLWNIARNNDTIESGYHKIVTESEEAKD
jgi:hypothetical protein